MSEESPPNGRIVLAQPNLLATSHDQLEMAAMHQSRQNHAMDTTLAGAGVQHTVFSIQEIIGYIRKYWILATLIGLVAGASIFLYMQSREPVYESTAIVLLNQSSGKQLNLQTIEPDQQSEYNLPQLVNNLQMEIGSDKFRLSYYKNISPELRADIVDDPTVEAQSYSEESLFLDRLSGMVNINVIKDSHMISVTVKHSDSNIAADVANTYVSHYSDYAKDNGLEMTRKVVSFLETKAAELLIRVNEQEAKLLEFRAKEGIVSAEPGTDYISAKITVLNTQLVNTRLQEENLKGVILDVESVGNDPEEILKVPALAESPVLENAYAKLIDSRANVTILGTAYGEKHPRMIVAVGQQALAEGNLQKLVTQAVGSLRRQLESSIAKVKSLEVKVEEAKRAMMQAGNKNVRLELQEQQLKVSRDLYSSLVQQMNEAGISLQFAGVDRIRITEEARASRTPVSPSKPLSMVLGAVIFCSCFFGIPLILGLGQRLLALGKEDEILETSRQVDPTHSIDTQPVVSVPVQSSFPAADFSNLASFPSIIDSTPASWLRNVTSPATKSGEDLNHFVKRSVIAAPNTRGLIITSEKTNSAKGLTAAAVSLAAAKQGLRVLFVSGANLAPSTLLRLKKENYAQSHEVSLKSAEELLGSFATEEENLYFITDDAWRRTPVLCLDTLFNAQQYIDLIVFDAPLISDDASLGIMASFASKCIFVRGEAERYDYFDLQSKLHSIMPNCPVAGEFMTSV